MLQLIVVEMLWIPAILGWGALVRRKLLLGDDYTLGETGLLGLLFFGVSGLVLNFFIPISLPVSIVAWGVGAALLFFLRPKMREDIPFNTGLFLLIAFFAAGSQQVFDTGRYYFPTLLWHWEEAMPLGLGNLNNHYAFNSLWFTIASFLRLPYFGDGAVYSLNPIVGFFVGSSLLTTLKKDDHYSFILVVFLLVEGTLLAGAGTLSPDVGATLISLYVILLCLSSGERRSELILLLSFLSVLSKLSQLPVLMVVGVTYFLAKRPPILRRVIIASVLIVVVWLARSVFLSGCLIFPFESSCVALPWTVAKERVGELRIGIKNFAFGVTQGNPLPPGYLKAWWIEIFHQRFTWLWIAFLMVGTVALFIRKARLDKRQLWLVLVLIAGAIYGMWNAAAIRFSYAVLVSIPVFIAAIAMQRYRLPKNAKAITFLLCFLLVGRRGWSVSHQDFFRPVQLPEIPEPKLKTFPGVLGSSFFYAIDSTCWKSSIFCTEERWPTLGAIYVTGRWLFYDVARK